MVGIVEQQLDKYAKEFFEHADDMMEIPLIKSMTIKLTMENGAEFECSRSKDDVISESHE